MLIGAAAGLSCGIFSNLKFSSEPASVAVAVTPKRYASPEECKLAIAELRAALPGARKVATDPVLLRTYGSSSNSYHPDSPHAVVVRPENTEDVVTIYPTGSICVDMSGMNKIFEIHVEDGDLVCQAGARWEDINAQLRERDLPLFFPARHAAYTIRLFADRPGMPSRIRDPTIGGMVGTRCSGSACTHSPKWSLLSTVVLSNGDVVKTKRRARKSSTGFDTTKLFIGAEGTLGIVTEATLRLAPVVSTKVAMAQFPDPEHAVSAVREILLSPYGANVQCIEFLDDNMMAAINSVGVVDEPLPVSDSHFFKLQGAPEVITAAAETASAIVNAHGASRFAFARTEEDAEQLWQSRKYALMATLADNPGARGYITDLCVPPSKLPEFVHETKKDLAAAGIKATIVGHVGDDNFHSCMLFHDDKQLSTIEAASHRLVYRALALDGTCTGEHGAGIGKKEFLVDELGLSTIALMWTVKNAIDPLNIMNPGKDTGVVAKHSLEFDLDLSCPMGLGWNTL
ncbi:FAD-linked oxidase-like protein [Vararia minispora EC-137]|uniref:FAD-linked oxidase-like protein n=1 Tax=Vararia minispora EC-137 TaxID=1314806 RepID=A0ACB8QUX2_9AGAM|nr:FAD-linked oxidase-like protein [Vararia minispora EC-137]